MEDSVRPLEASYMNQQQAVRRVKVTHYTSKKTLNRESATTNHKNTDNPKRQAVTSQLGTRATKTTCPNCKKQGKWYEIELKPPYICSACGYSMWEKRCINYPRNIIVSLQNTMTTASRPNTHTLERSKQAPACKRD